MKDKYDNHLSLISISKGEEEFSIFFVDQLLE